MSTHQAEFIKYRREAKGLNKNQVAKLLGVSAQFYGMVESGKVSLPLRYVRKFIKITSDPMDVPEHIHKFICAVSTDNFDYLSLKLKGKK